MGAGKRRAAPSVVVGPSELAYAASALSRMARERLRQEGRECQTAPDVAPTLEKFAKNRIARIRRSGSPVTAEDLHTIEINWRLADQKKRQHDALLTVCQRPVGAAAELQRSLGALVISLYKLCHEAFFRAKELMPAHSVASFCVGVFFSTARGVVCGDHTTVLIPSMPLLSHVLPLARIDNAARNAARHAAGPGAALKYRNGASLARLSSHRGSVVLQGALRCTGDDVDFWREATDIAGVVAMRYRGLLGSLQC